MVIVVTTGGTIRETRDMRKGLAITIERKEKGQRKRQNGFKKREQRERSRGGHRNTKNLKEARKEWKIGNQEERVSPNQREESNQLKNQNSSYFQQRRFPRCLTQKWQISCFRLSKTKRRLRKRARSNPTEIQRYQVLTRKIPLRELLSVKE